MITGQEILKRVVKGDIVIEPFNPVNINPNSYNITLGGELMVYTGRTLDVKKQNKTKVIQIPENGIVLKPGRLYLGVTQEWTETYNLVPKIEGRSSIGRLGLFIHITAGFGDIGFCGRWTLELVATKRVRVYAGMKIGQLSYYLPEGDIGIVYEGKYQNSMTVQGSAIHKDLEDAAR